MDIKRKNIQTLLEIFFVLFLILIAVITDSERVALICGALTLASLFLIAFNEIRSRIRHSPS